MQIYQQATNKNKTNYNNQCLTPCGEAIKNKNKIIYNYQQRGKVGNTGKKGGGLRASNGAGNRGKKRQRVNDEYSNGNSIIGINGKKTQISPDRKRRKKLSDYDYNSD